MEYEGNALFNNSIYIVWYLSGIRYSSRASLQLNTHTRMCLGKFVIKLACSLCAVRVHLAHASAFIVCESWTSALNACKRCMSAFNACECCTSACECSKRTWRSHWSSSLLPSLKTTILSSIGRCFKLACTRQIIDQGHGKKVIADEPCYIRAFRWTCCTLLRCIKTAMRSYNLHDFIRILRNIPAQVTICTISYVAIGITHMHFYINYNEIYM